MKIKNEKKRFFSFLCGSTLSSILALSSIYPAIASEPDSEDSDDENEVEITLIHIGDIHGHLDSRVNVRSDSNGLREGGLARIYSKLKKIRKHADHSLTIMTGDTIHGSAEALFTQGQALVDPLNKFGIDVFAPGNWEYVYGTKRFHELFTGKKPGANWNAIASNLYYTGAPYEDKIGQRVLPSYWIKDIAGIKIGVIGFTTERGPKVIGSEVVDGFGFSKGDDEIAELVPLMREVHKVDLVVMISELNLANNYRLTEAVPGVDIVFSSDMHEETPKMIRNSNGTVLVAEGMDGSNVGEMQVEFKNGKLVEIEWKQHAIDTRIKEDKKIAKLVAKIKAPFYGDSFVPHVNPINGTTLNKPLDTVIGAASVDLHRSNFAHENMPGVVEGTSHDFLADVFRDMTGADLGVIRGFRYGTTVAAGPITLGDIYHFVPIGPYLAYGEVTGKQIKGTIEKPADGSLNPDVAKWGGGWLFGWSGLRYDLDPYQTLGNRASNIEIYNRATGVWEPLDMNKTYTLAGYNYDSEPNRINKVPAKNVIQLKEADGSGLTVVNAVARYLQSSDANPQQNRITLMRPLPDLRPLLGFPMIQSIFGAREDLAPY